MKPQGKLPQSRVLRMVEGNCPPTFSSPPTAGLSSCSRTIGKTEHCKDPGLQNLKMQRSAGQRASCYRASSEGLGQGSLNNISVFLLGFWWDGFFFFTLFPLVSLLNNQLAFLRPEEMWRMAVFQKSENSEKKQNVITFATYPSKYGWWLFPKSWNMIIYL